MKPEKKIIDGTEYQVTPLGAVIGRKVLLRLTKVFSPALLSKDLSSLLEQLDDETLDYLCDTFAESTNVVMQAEKTKVLAPLAGDMFDKHFARKYMQMFEWLAFCVEVNYADFFARVAVALKAATAKLKGLSSTAKSESEESDSESPST